ncbi:MAG TPA: hypothetical protein VN837_22565 [Chloroflexota bacterium]|nr:hypothetical protein [Chloroflexota bacterium]
MDSRLQRTAAGGSAVTGIVREVPFWAAPRKPPNGEDGVPVARG